jgi:hypothetical protein
MHWDLFFEELKTKNQSNDHPQEDLAKSDYKPFANCKTLIGLLYFFCYILKTKYKNSMIFINFPHFWRLKTSKITSSFNSEFQLLKNHFI